MKRASERQLARDDDSSDDDGAASADGLREGFERAPPEVMARRRIVRVRRTGASSSSSAAAPATSGAGVLLASAPVAPVATANPFANAFAMAKASASSSSVIRAPPDPTPTPGMTRTQQQQPGVAAEQDAVPATAAPDEKPSAASEQEQDATTTPPAAGRQPAESVSAGGEGLARDTGKTDAVEGGEKDLAAMAPAVHTNGAAVAEGISAANNGARPACENGEGKLPDRAKDDAGVDAIGDSKGAEIDASAAGSGVDSTVSRLSPPSTSALATAEASVPVAVSETNVVTATASAPDTATIVASGGGVNTLISSTPTGPSTLTAGFKAAAEQRSASTFSFGRMTSGVTFGDAAAAAASSTGFSFAQIPAPPANGASLTGLVGSNGMSQPASGIGSVGRESALGLVKLDETDLVTGEEEEEEAFRARCKLYRLEEGSSKWLERGVGPMKLNRHKETKRSRLLMRTEATHRVILNTPVFNGFILDRASDRSVRFQGINVDDETKYVTYLARFNSKDDVSRLATCVDDCSKQGPE